MSTRENIRLIARAPLHAYFAKLTFSKTSFRNTFRVSISFDPDQTHVGPDLDSIFLQRLSADDTSSQWC